MNNITLVRVSKFLAECKTELDGWFGIDLPMPELMILQSVGDVAAIWDRKINDDLPLEWVDLERHKLYILHPVEALKIRKKTPYNFYTLLKHEYVHLYWHALVKSNLPMWMNEGLACYLAGQKLKLYDKNLILKIMDYFDHKNSRSYDAYAVGYVSVKYLIESYGKRGFLLFLKKLSKLPSKITRKIDKKEFEQLFQKHFHLSLSRRAIKQILKDIP